MILRRNPIIGTSGGGRAFTLVELLVAVAALTLIALGLSRVFAATGQTLRAGRRVSRLNEYAAMVERQMRRDIAQMSRNGFLLIRNRKVNEGNAVQLWAEDPTSGRARRGDELLFFQEGAFRSVRDPIGPNRQATGSEARIYYGHGLQWNPRSREYTSAPNASFPRRASPSTFAPSFGQPGPNQYASDWTLLRHVTVLSGPVQAAMREELPNSARDNYPDNPYQVAWQPAASSIFRIDNETANSIGSTRMIRPTAENPPIFAGGLVDVAATDLAEVRSTILDAMPARSPSGSAASGNDARTQDQSEDSSLVGATIAARQPVWAPQISPGTLASPNMASPTRRMQAWMTEALPADSDYQSSMNERRIHCEPKAPDALGTLGASGSVGRAFPADQSWRRTDQSMLTAWNFVPNCTEFIVEWSFGRVYPPNYSDNAKRGKVIWHGMTRTVDGVQVASPYPDSSGVSTEDQNVVLVQSYGAQRAGTAGLLGYLVPGELIHYLPPGMGLNRNTTLYSCFGYIDPFFSFAGGDAPAVTVPWAWPKLLRVTMRLADPQSPGVEETFEFVFELPERPVGTQN